MMVTVIKREKAENHEYKYLIRKGVYSWTAFHTEEGFNKFMEILKLENGKTEVNENPTYGKIEITMYEKEIEDTRFWTMEDVKDYEHFIGLSNGNYTDCYYKTTKDKVIIARPNPNAKEVYKPYDYFEMAKIWG